MPPPAETAQAASAAPPRALGGETQTTAELAAAVPRSLPRPSALTVALSSLKGVGPRLAEAAAEIGIVTLGDLLRHAPHSYRDRRSRSTIAAMAFGEEASLEVEVRSVRKRPTRRRNLTIVEAQVADETGTTTATWFNQAWLAEKLKPGMRLRLQGTLDRRGIRVSAHEDAETAEGGLHTGRLVPVHPASERLKADRIREWVWQALPLARHAIEPLPAEIRSRRRLAGVEDALRALHFPAESGEAEAARARVAFEELFLYQAALAARRQRRECARRAPAIVPGPSGGLVDRWLASLPFEPTGDQRAAFAEIDSDLYGERPMQRLLMGEVGSGKTVVALHAMLRAVEAGHQAALMAPTETLAEQHFATLERLLAAEGLPTALLTGATPAASRRELLGHLASGQLGLIVGTHALIEPSVSFARLTVAVVDEQHRFGVRQRAALDAKGPDGLAPHTLHMTATPIPRTLSLTAYGDLDTTALKELPAGRRPVKTWAVGEEKRAGAYDFIRERLREGRQCFVVCPLVSESEKLQATAATDEAKRLAEGEFAEFAVGVMHGQMPTPAKQAAMASFVSGATDVLVATTVIEVGIDVPNASVMVIEEADRYGLSQLHQLRGRIGRGEHESHCILFADPQGEMARLRMAAIASENDGFKLAETDLSLRGEGEILGTRQHGLPRFRVAELPEDTATLIVARQEVVELIRRDGGLDELVMAAVRERYPEDEIAA